MIKLRNLDPGLASLVSGLMVGNVYYVGTNGSDTATGASYKLRMKSLGTAVRRAVSGNHDYILLFGSETGASTVTISAANLHIIGCSLPLDAAAGGGYIYTCPATVDTIESSGTPTGVEIANITFVCNATDHILVDWDAGDYLYFHHNAVYGSGTASDAIRLDLEAARCTVAYNVFQLCKLPIDFAGAECHAIGNYIHDVDTAAKGVTLSANTADRCVVRDNLFNLSGGTGDIGISVASGADRGTLYNNYFHASCNDNISDSGTGTFKVANFEGAITGTSGASIILAVQD